MLSLVENSARRGAAIVRQLLMYSRGQPSERTRVQLRQVVNEIAQMGRETFPPNIAIAVASAPDLWPVEASPTELYQVVLNLCVNARDAMPDGGVLTLTLDHASRAQPARSADSTPKGKWVRLVVQDTGSGIPPEILSRIFDPFFTTKAIGKGSGLGLSTAAGIVKGHGGEIRVESQPGRGTRFEVILPAWTDDSAEQGTVPLPAARPERATLLFIDRSAAVRESLSQFLEGHGYQVLQAESGADAQRVLAAGGPRLRLIITDTALTGSAGPDLIRQLRSAAPAIPVVATSSLATAAAREEMLAAGAAEILIQPMPPAALLRVVREVLARSAP
jgi:CheY-like chemotaxis protein